MTSQCILRYHSKLPRMHCGEAFAYHSVSLTQFTLHTSHISTHFSLSLSRFSVFVINEYPVSHRRIFFTAESGMWKVSRVSVRHRHGSWLWMSILTSVKLKRQENSVDRRLQSLKTRVLRPLTQCSRLHLLLLNPQNCGLPHHLWRSAEWPLKG